MQNGPQRRTPVAGGIFIAGGMILGAIVGVTQHQPSAGMVIGLGCGILIAAAIWLLDCRGPR